eukprot:Ihof_evm1s535 gene=Ihof_evmTU1s535
MPGNSSSDGNHTKREFILTLIIAARYVRIDKNAKVDPPTNLESSTEDQVSFETPLPDDFNLSYYTSADRLRSTTNLEEDNSKDKRLRHKIDLQKLIPREVVASVPANKYAIITDENVASFHLASLLAGFQDEGVTVFSKVLPPGEQTKSRDVKNSIEDWLLSHHFNRDSCLIALGGGVIGDLVGFVAATYLRGIPFIQVPTTLLAMVDSSVGGKTGIDTSHGKNLIGAFHQPVRIIMSMHYLRTLPLRQLTNGMAECIKTACIWDQEEFEYLEQHSDDIMTGNTEVLMHIVMNSAGVKAQVVTLDEKEGGLRGLLNFGHTIGHAVEALCQPMMLHGEAVAIGMAREMMIARSMGVCPQRDIRRMIGCLRLYGLDPTLPGHLLVNDLMDKMGVDKKNKGGMKAVVVIKEVGTVYDKKPVPISDSLIRKVLAEHIIVVPAPLGVQGTVRVEGSKSISNRVLLMSALARGTNIYLGNAGTAARFLTTTTTFIPSTTSCVLTGNSRMKQRPIGPLVDALCNNGANIQYQETNGCLPLRISGGGLIGGSIDLSAAISSQYVSSILIGAPYAANPVTLTLTGGEVVSQPYIDMTLQLLAQFGVYVNRKQDTNIYEIPQTPLTNPPEFMVEGDASSATYPLAIAAITGGSITVDNVGSNSLQGDAQFCRVLQSMGCVVHQTPTTTTVTGPPKGQSLKAISVDLMTMTDAFMTAAVLCAVAEGTSQLTGIANQRVKECNRLAVMVEEMGKLGIQARELPDGIEIVGMPANQIHGNVVINCHDDHRIAMSFAVLGCAVEGIIISEKYCVDKTYPMFWDHLESILGVQTITPLEDEILKAASPAIDQVHDSSQSTIVIIGMRGAGKTQLGKAAANGLGRKFIDLDEYIATMIGIPVKELIETKGWKAFREEEVKWLLALLEDPAYKTDYIISCGGGIVESDRARAILASYPLVVQIYRPIKDIVAYLNEDKTRPQFTEDPTVVWERRKDLYAQCRTYIFPVLAGENNWPMTEQDLVQFLKRVLGSNHNKDIPSSHPSFFLSLTYPDLNDAIAGGVDLGKISIGCHAVELRVDLLSSVEPQFILQQVALIRRHISLPIIFTVRSEEQGGAYKGDDNALFSLLRLGVEMACEYVDVEIKGEKTNRMKLLANRKSSLIIGSYHVTSPITPWDDVRDRFIETWCQGDVDVVKVVTKAQCIDDVFRMRQIITSLPFKAPIIGLVMGDKGSLSRAFNLFLTPVTHPLLPCKAAPGQLSVNEIHVLRHQLGIISPRSFYLIGSPITHSPSPLMHNTAFKVLDLPHTYGLKEGEDITACVKIFADADFGGCSVTIPHKVSVIPYLDKLSKAATEIGAVNTVIRLEDNKLLGDNTDWMGIYQCVINTLKANGRPIRPKVGLVLGAGGTSRAACYALKQMGVTDLILFNRTYSKAVALADIFGGRAVEYLLDINDTSTNIDVIVSTVPASSDLTMPGCLLTSKPIVMDVAYKPRNTPVLVQAKSLGCPTA